MLEMLKTRLEKYGNNNVDKFNFIREYLQLLILRILDEKKFFKDIAFLGGTALRILYDLKRFSEDLDFSVVHQNHFSFIEMLNTIINELKLENLSLEVKFKEDKTVAWGLIKFNELLHNLGLSPHKNEKFFIKLEVDKNPPAGYKTDFTIINKEFLIGINHYDLPSLFSGKLHAVLFRKYHKGRDFYDLIWYLTHKIQPNYILLSNAIYQTEHHKIELDSALLQNLLRDKIQKIDFKKIREDVSPFLIDSKETRFFEKEYFLKLIETI